jgi:hypothetical protein
MRSVPFGQMLVRGQVSGESRDPVRAIYDDTRRARPFAVQGFGLFKINR